MDPSRASIDLAIIFIVFCGCLNVRMIVAILEPSTRSSRLIQDETDAHDIVAST